MLGAAVSIPIAVAVPLAIEYIRRPILRIELDDPVFDDRWSIAHVRVRNLPMAERNRLACFLGRWLTALPAHGCSLQVYIGRDDDDGDPIAFGGKWTSRQGPVSKEHVWAGSELRRIESYDPQKLPGIHDITLQPGLDGDLVAIAIRARGAASAYAYWAERIYDPPGMRSFPEHPDCELPPGTYRVDAIARAGEVQSPWKTLELTVERDTDSLSLSGPS